MFSSLDNIRTQTNAASQAEAAKDLIDRLIGARGDEFEVGIQPGLQDSGKDVFKVWVLYIACSGS